MTLRPGWAAIVLFVLVVASVVVGCGGRTAQPRVADGSLPSASSPAGTGTGSGAGAGAGGRSMPGEPPRTGPLADRLRRALLSLHDLPAGWRRSEDARGNPADTAVCGTTLASLERQADKLAEVEIGFQQSGIGPFLVHAVAAYPTGVAERVLTNLAAAVGSCRQIVVRDTEGSLTPWEVHPVPFPPLGDQTVAFREYQAVNQVEALVVYVRRGDMVAVLVDIAVRAPVDQRQAEMRARRADERLADAARDR
jgi:hypothetical protein